jgi:hypothetical protein
MVRLYNADFMLIDRVRPFFHWKYSGVFIPLFFAIGVAMALGNRFALAYVSFAFFGVWALCFWQTSDLLRNKKHALGSRQKKRNVILASRALRNYFYWKWGVSVFLLAITYICIAFVHAAEIEHELESYEGELIPADDPAPPNPCIGRAPSGASIFYFGNSAAWSKSFHQSLINIGGAELLSTDRGPEGRLSINAEIFGPDQKIIAKIRNNRFTVNRNNILKMERKDLSSLRVVDQYDQEVLKVRYLNPGAIKFLGLLYFPGLSRPLIIQENQQVIYGNTFSYGCFGNGGIRIDLR